jgi:hypothetical protein
VPPRSAGLRLADLHREVFRPLIWNPTGEVSLYKNAPTVALIFAMASPAFAAKGFWVGARRREMKTAGALRNMRRG